MTLRTNPTGPTSPPTDLTPAGANLRGIAWMVLSMAAFAVEDVLVKRAARELPLSEVLMLFGFGGAAVFAAAGWCNGWPLFHRDACSRRMALRAVFELVGRLFYALAITLTPLSSATAILQATPILVVLGAKIFYGEDIGWRRWVAVFVGLVGVMIVLRPDSSDVSLLSLLTVIGLVGFAGRDLASRSVSRSLQIHHLGFFGFLTVVAAGGLYAICIRQTFVRISTSVGLLLAFGCVVGAGAYSALMKAMRTGEIAAVTPFRYSRLIFGVGLGVLAFNEPFSQRILIGCCVILSAGLLIAWDGRRGRAG